MLAIAFIVNSVLAIIFILLSCFVKMTSKNLKNFTGFGKGICCFFITFVFDLLLFVIFATLIYFTFKEELDEINEKLDVDHFYEIESMDLLKVLSILWEISKAIIILLIICFFAIILAQFILLFVFIKKLANQEYIYKTIFMFISGYIFLYGFTFAGNIYYSLYPEEYYEDNHSFDDEQMEKNLLYFTSFALMFILNIIGTSIMLFLHHKRASSSLIFISMITFFGPFISLILLISFKQLNEYYYYLIGVGIFSVASFIIGIFMYCKYKDREEFDTKQIGILEPQVPIQPPY